MPWVKIPASNLPLLPMFGIDHLEDDGDFAWYRGANGRMRIEKSNPCVFFEDVTDAHQCGATAVLVKSPKA